MQSLLTVTVAAMAAAIAFSAVEPPPIPAPGPQRLAAAERTIKCKNNEKDAALINRRIDASKVGDELIFEGPCLVNQTIKLLGHRAYRGRSRTGTVIKQADGANLEAIFASDSYLDNNEYTGLSIALRSMTIDGNRANNPQARDSLVLRSWQTIVEDIQISDSNRHAIRLTNLSANLTPLKNTQVNGRISNLQINDSGGSALYVEDTDNAVTDWQFKDSYIANTGGSGIHMDNAAGWFITGNHIYGDNGFAALFANRLWGTSISNNYIESFATHGIIARVQGGFASTISTNRIFNNSGRDGTYLLVEGNYAHAKVAVTGNAIRGNGGGIGLDYQRDTAESLEVSSSGNQVSDVEIEKRVGEGVNVSAGQFAAR